MRAWMHRHLHIGPPVKVDRGAALRAMLERLGGVFVKFGQIMAMRPDLLPPEMIEALSQLLDNAPKFPGDVAARIVEKELGRPIDTVFAHFDFEPIAAASFAQVHRATLLTGDQVVVKVQRPGIRRRVQMDLRFVQLMARLVDLLGLLHHIRLRPIVSDFVAWTQEELDYVTEATLAERMRRASETNPYEYIPRIFWDYVTPRMLVQEYLQGMWISDVLAALAAGDHARLDEFRSRGLDLRRAAYNIFHAGLHQTFDEDVFHADPHAGNIVLLAQNVPGYIDFGITGELSETFREIQAQLLQFLEQGKVEQFVRTLFKLFYPPPVTTNVEDLEERMRQNVRRWLNNVYNRRATLHERSSAFLLTKNFATAREFGLSYSSVAVRYYRALMVAELIVLQLDPDFDTRANIREFFVRHQLRKLDRDRAPLRLATRAFNRRELVLRLPAIVDRLSDLTDREIASVRTTVSTLILNLARLFRTLAVIGIVILIVAVVVDLAYPDVFKHYFPFTLPVYIAILVPGVPLLFWLAKILDSKSVNRGSYTRFSR
jgi:ubiquinone biosynthesis protein